MATADAMIGVFDAKYHYEFWRPVTAIRNGDEDGNAANRARRHLGAPGPTPMHPSIPARIASSRGSAGTVMQAVFGTGTLPEFTLATPTAPGSHASVDTFEDYISEPSNARIWRGSIIGFQPKSNRYGSEDRRVHRPKLLATIEIAVVCCRNNRWRLFDPSALVTRVASGVTGESRATRRSARRVSGAHSRCGKCPAPSISRRS